MVKRNGKNREHLTALNVPHLGEKINKTCANRPVSCVNEGVRTDFGSPLGSNGDDRRQRRKQGGAVGAAASRMQATAQQTLGAATRAVASRRRDGEVSFRCGSRSGSPPYNLSVSLSLDSSPSRGASGEEGSFSDDSRSPKIKTAPSRKIPRWSGDIQETLSRRC